MRRRIALVFSLVSLFTCLLVYAFPIPVLQIRAAENGAMIFCAPLARDEEIFYASVNSIYNVPAIERWRVREDGAIQVVEVVSSAAVMEYYHLDDYADAGNATFRASPRDRIYRQVRMKVDARGQEKLIVRGKEIALSELVPEATVILLSIENRPRARACD